MTVSLRDIALTLFLLGGLPFALKRPFYGAVIFAWLGMMNPHRMTWGFAYDVSWAQMYAIATILGMLVTKDRAIGDSLWRYRFVLLYVAWGVFTTVFALEQQAAVTKLIEILKVQTMCLVTLVLMTTRARVEALAIVATLSIAYFGIKGGIFTILQGGEYRVWGPPDSIITDNNHLAVGLAMTVPLVYWLYQRVRYRLLRLALIGALLLIALSVLGSYSRSAFLGLCAMSLFLILKSDRKLLLIPLVGVGVAAAFVLMPEKYWDRIASIGTYQEDGSAMGRINTWTTAVNIANDRITGGGYEYYSRRSFAMYAPNPIDVHSSHSIYFQSLGEHGWIGLAIFLSIWMTTWWSASRIRKRLPDTNEGRSLDLLLRMIQVSLICFAVGGATVNIGNWDFVYYEAAMVFAVGRLVVQKRLSETDPGSAQSEPRTKQEPSWMGSGRRFPVPPRPAA